MELSREAILKGIYNGTYSVYELPISLYEYTANQLHDAVIKGYGNAKTAAEELLLTDLIENILMFSAAKTFQQVKEISDNLFDRGKKILYDAFLLTGGKVFDRFQEYLIPELDTSEWASRSASRWMDFQDNAGSNPYLMYHAEVDRRICTICKPLDKILIPMNDSFWKENATPQHFNCRCRVELVKGIDVRNSVANKFKISTQEEIKIAVEKSHKHKDPMFNYNPGLDRVIFKDKGKNKHPYFNVPNEFKEFAANNFGLPIPQLKTT